MKRADHPLVTFNGQFHIDGTPLTAKFNEKVNFDPEQRCSHCEKKIPYKSISYIMVLDYFGTNVCGKCVNDKICIIA